MRACGLSLFVLVVLVVLQCARFCVASELSLSLGSGLGVDWELFEREWQEYIIEEKVIGEEALEREFRVFAMELFVRDSLTVPADPMIEEKPGEYTYEIVDGNGNRNWTSCHNITVIGPTCITVYVFPRNLTVGIQLTVRNRTIIDLPFVGSSMCLSEKSLLKLLNVIPGLGKAIKIIKRLLKIRGFIPGSVLSECLLLTDIEYTPSVSLSACLSLNSTFMCWKNHCMYRAEYFFGCFKIPLHRLSVKEDRKWDSYVLETFGTSVQQLNVEVASGHLPKIVNRAKSMKG